MTADGILPEHLDATMRVVSTEASGPVIDGERDAAPVAGPEVRCALFVTTETEDDQPVPRANRRGTILVALDGVPIALGHADEVAVVSPRLNAAEGRDADTAVLWRVDGRPLVLGAPGEPPFGLNATVLRVET